MDTEMIKNISSIVQWIALILTIIVILLAICGMLCKCIKNRCLACTYGITLLPFWILLLVVGAIFLFASEGIIEKLVDECIKNGIQVPITDNDDFSVKFTAEGSDGVQVDTEGKVDVTISLGIYDLIGINQHMCSENCPCKDIPNKSQWTNLSAEELKSTFRRDEPFVFSATEPHYSSYSECIRSRS